MAHYTLIARINAGDRKFPFVNVQFSKNHRPIPIEGATYYLRPGSRGRRAPIRIGKDFNAAMAALLNMEHSKPANNFAGLPTIRDSVPPITLPRKTVAEAAQEYVERSKQKSRKTFIGYRTVVALFVQTCKKTFFDEICRDDVLDYLSFLNCKSQKTGGQYGESTVFNYFLKTMVFLNDRGIAKYVAKEDWVQQKDWPVNVDKRNKNKKYATYQEEEIAGMLHVANEPEEALIRFLVGTGFRIGEAAVAEWADVDWEEKAISVRFKPKFGFRPKDYEERTIVVSDSLLECLKKYGENAPQDALIFPSPTTGTVDKHLDRIIYHVIDKPGGLPRQETAKALPCFQGVVCHSEASARRRHRDTATGTWTLRHFDNSDLPAFCRPEVRQAPGSYQSG